jgi:hypothetical protein
MKKLFNVKLLASALSAGLMAVSALAWSQTAATPDAPIAPVASDKSEKAKPAASAKKAATKKVATKKEPVKPARSALKLDAINLAVAVEAADAALTPVEFDIATRVYLGKLPCELGANVTLTADEKNPGYFHVEGKNFKYYMFPVATTTGAIRLEDRKAGAVWLQLANKSMLMNHKLGTRLADECASPVQVAAGEALKLNPVSVLDEPKPVLPAASPAAAAPAK